MSVMLLSDLPLNSTPLVIGLVVMVLYAVVGFVADAFGGNRK